MNRWILCLLLWLAPAATAEPWTRSVLCETPGGHDLALLTATPRSGGDGRAVLVVADPLGTTPIAADWARHLARRVAELDDGPTWYLVPGLSPDAGPDGRNARPVDDDADGRTDEDGPDDLDGDGRITTLLLEDPAGAWLIDPATGLARKADSSEGERGRYLRLSEGRDDDEDGQWNEDGPGGVIPGRNFPHGFTHWKPAHGPWSASEPESRALLRFAFAHPEIALVLVLGDANTLRTPPAPGDVPDPLHARHKPPRWIARAAGLDPLKEYSLAELTPVARTVVEDPNLTELDVLNYLNLGPATAPAAADLKWWSAAASAWNDSLEVAPRAASAPGGPGTVQDWAYYQFGVPAFAVDLWTAPMVALADSTAPPPDDPDALALKVQPGAWVEWTDVTLPDGRVGKTGGLAPFAATTPPAAAADSLMTARSDFLLELPAWLPSLDGLDLRAEHRGGPVWRVEAVVRNGGRIPYPTAQGRRTRRPGPVVLTLDGAEVLEGPARRLIKSVPAGGAASLAWIVRAQPGDRIEVQATAPGFGAADARLELRTRGGRR